MRRELAFRRIKAAEYTTGVAKDSTPMVQGATHHQGADAHSLAYCWPSSRFDHHGSEIPPSMRTVLPVM